MSNPYNTPATELNEESSYSRTAFWGITLQFAPFIGLIITILIMLSAFDALAHKTGSEKTAALALHITQALWSTCIGLALGIIGMILHALALFKYKYRSPRFYRWTKICSILLLLNFPIGTFIALYVISYLKKHKDEFSSPHA